MCDYNELVKKLDDGELSVRVLESVIIQHTRNQFKKMNLTDAVDLLCGKEGDAGIMRKHYNVLHNVIGSMELAIRRTWDK